MPGSYSIPFTSHLARPIFVSKRNKMNRIVGMLGGIVVTCVLACSKPIEDKTAKLVIDLHQSAISINHIDSADVVFRKTGTNTQVRQRFVKTMQNLMVPMRSLTPGTWNADIEVYTKTVNQQSNQYVFIKPILITEQATDTQIPGPGPTSGNGWVKRYVKASAGNQVVAIIPEDVYDSYFEVRTKEQGPLVFGVQREAINVNHVVELKSWACTNTCLNAEGRITDINHFMPFTETIFSAPWTRNEINISVFNNKSEELLKFEHTWHK